MKARAEQRVRGPAHVGASRFGLTAWRNSRPLRWTLAATATSCIAGVLPAALGRDLGVQFVAVLAALATSVVTAVWLEKRRVGDLFSPLALCGAFYLIAFVGGSTFYWFNPDFGQGAVTLPFGHQALMVTTALALLGWIGLAAGYFARPFAFLRIPPLRLAASTSSSHRTIAALYGVGWVARLVEIANGLYFHGSGPGVFVPATGSTFNQMLLVLSVLPSLAVAYAGVMALTTREKKWRRLYWAGLAIEASYYLPSGKRSDVVSVALLALTVAYYIRGRLPSRLLVLSIVLGVFVLFPVIHLYRGAGGEAGYATNASSNLQQGVAAYAERGPSQILLYGVGTTFSRFSDVLIPAALVEQDRRYYPIEPGTTLAWAGASLVPHVLWPDKPNPGLFSSELAYAVGVSNTSDTSVSTTQIGEMYLNFGTIGVLLGMVFVGGLYRELGEWLRERKRRPMVLALYAALAYQILGSGETIVAGGLVGPIRTMVVISVLLWIMLRLTAPRVLPGQVSLAADPLPSGS